MSEFEGPDFGNSVAYPVVTRRRHYVFAALGGVVSVVLLVVALEADIHELPDGMVKDLVITGVVMGMVGASILLGLGLSGIVKVRRRL